jgi:hypothetical protein
MKAQKQLRNNALNYVGYVLTDERGVAYLLVGPNKMIRDDDQD